MYHSHLEGLSPRDCSFKTSHKTFGNFQISIADAISKGDKLFDTAVSQRSR